MTICRAHVFSMTICRAHVFILFRFQPPSGSGSFFLAALRVWLFLFSRPQACLAAFRRAFSQPPSGVLSRPQACFLLAAVSHVLPPSGVLSLSRPVVLMYLA